MTGKGDASLRTMFLLGSIVRSRACIGWPRNFVDARGPGDAQRTQVVACRGDRCTAWTGSVIHNGGGRWSCVHEGLAWQRGR